MKTTHCLKEHKYPPQGMHVEMSAFISLVRSDDQLGCMIIRYPSTKTCPTALILSVLYCILCLLKKSVSIIILLKKGGDTSNNINPRRFK
jgi:hypothetical protein